MEAKVALLEEKLAALDLAYRELSQKFSRRDTPTTEANSEVFCVRFWLLDHVTSLSRLAEDTVGDEQ